MLKLLINGDDPLMSDRLGPITCFIKKSVNVDFPTPSSDRKYNTDWFLPPRAMLAIH